MSRQRPVHGWSMRSRRGFPAELDLERSHPRRSWCVRFGVPRRPTASAGRESAPAATRGVIHEITMAGRGAFRARFCFLFSGGATADYAKWGALRP